MIEALVLDVSACMPWCCEDEATPSSEEMLTWAVAGARLYVPSIWPWEMMNAVAMAARRSRITQERAGLFFGKINTFNFRVDSGPAISEFNRLSGLASRYHLTLYDTAYLDLAGRLTLPLGTLDADLIRAAKSEGIAVLGK